MSAYSGHGALIVFCIVACFMKMGVLFTLAK